jgi:hypothetical protein
VIFYTSYETEMNIETEMIHDSKRRSGLMTVDRDRDREWDKVPFMTDGTIRISEETLSTAHTIQTRAL